MRNKRIYVCEIIFSGDGKIDQIICICSDKKGKIVSRNIYSQITDIPRDIEAIIISGCVVHIMEDLDKDRQMIDLIQRESYIQRHPDIENILSAVIKKKILDLLFQQLSERGIAPTHLSLAPFFYTAIDDKYAIRRTSTWEIDCFGSHIRRIKQYESKVKEASFEYAETFLELLLKGKGDGYCIITNETERNKERRKIHNQIKALITFTSIAGFVIINAICYLRVTGKTEDQSILQQEKFKEQMREVDSLTSVMHLYDSLLITGRSSKKYTAERIDKCIVLKEKEITLNEISMIRVDTFSRITFKGRSYRPDDVINWTNSIRNRLKENPSVTSMIKQDQGYEFNIVI